MGFLCSVFLYQILVQYTYSTRTVHDYTYSTCTCTAVHVEDCVAVYCVHVHVQSYTYVVWQLYGSTEIFSYFRKYLFSSEILQRCTFKVRKYFRTFESTFVHVRVLYTCTTLYTYSYDTSVLPTFHNPKVSCYLHKKRSENQGGWGRPCDCGV